ncbi:HrpA-like helicase [Vibrio maritimus]|uniref:HrpA-like helicase n=1 Tax=Vibrio maritimus TaxID=990268 RepID=A0A090T2H7_9VIBR|nr:HrpA-like helicase [Vibrio maritimus]
MILPIDAIEHDVKNALTHSHLIVEAETGSGKSTRLPIWAMEQAECWWLNPDVLPVPHWQSLSPSL